MRVLQLARKQRVVMVSGLLFLQLMAGAELAYPESRVFKCTGVSGQITFSQTGCERGIRESLVIDNPDVGWINLEKVVSKFKTKSKNEGEKRPKSKSSGSLKGDRAQQQRCWRARRKIARIARELKRGYKLSRGEELRFQRTEQEEYLALFCKEPLP